MGHKLLIDGTAYEVTGGRLLVDGTAYNISKGRTLIDGTGYDVGFIVEPLIVYDGGDTLLNGTAVNVTNAEIRTSPKETYIRLHTTSSGSTNNYAIYPISGIDFTKYKTLNFTGYTSNTSYQLLCGYSQTTQLNKRPTAYETIQSKTSTTVTVDISNVSGTDLYIVAQLFYIRESFYGYITKIWLE